MEDLSLIFLYFTLLVYLWSSLIFKDPIHQTVKVVQQPPPSASTSSVTVLPRNFHITSSAKVGNVSQQQMAASVRKNTHVGPTGSTAINQLLT